MLDPFSRSSCTVDTMPLPAAQCRGLEQNTRVSMFYPSVNCLMYHNVIYNLIIIIIIIRTFIKRHKSGNIHSEALYMSMYT